MNQTDTQAQQADDRESATAAQQLIQTLTVAGLLIIVFLGIWFIVSSSGVTP